MTYTPNSDIRDADTGEQITATTQPHPSSHRPCVMLKLAGGQALLHPDAAMRLAADILNAADLASTHWEPWLLHKQPKPLRDFLQIDGWANIEPGDDIMDPDVDGDVILSGKRRDPQSSGTTVRILIADGADRDDVVRILRKQLAWFERDSTLGHHDENPF